ncbi:transcription initiation TFIID-like, putative [Plasmodium ovale wallikeri]|uniref:Transcription initiation TFIID-like, putative n=1 Tax=Plasmodium ovale wallikeri TaxID=864142 RepID=A0A1A8ZPH9_PLAOA|nr:transcription initiation TFIID-like, putative [Plasmodium ovale wallikeri]SBT45789.1 transcription initiation TFIID-like, putative [Plasmodium ovale wallikeri]
MSQPVKKSKLSYTESKNIFVNNENSMSVHNISMNAVLCSTLNLDSIYRYFANCIYNPREFKCMRIDVPVSLKTVNKYVNYLREKRERGKREREMEELERQDLEKCAREQLKREEKDEEKEKKEEEIDVAETVTEQCNNEVPEKGNASPLEKVNKDTGIPESDLPNNEIPSTESATLSDDFILRSGYEKLVSDDFSEHYNDNVGEKLVINVSIFSNGKIICTGNNSIEACKIAMKKVEKKLKILNFKNIKLKKITITNILAVYNVGFSIVLPLFAQFYKNVDYDPNVFPACKVKIALTNEDEKNASERREQNDCTYAWCSAKSTADKEKSKVDIVSASIFSTGNITLTGGKSYENLQRCIDMLLPYLIKSKSQH